MLPENIIALKQLTEQIQRNEPKENSRVIPIGKMELEQIFHRHIHDQ